MLVKGVEELYFLADNSPSASKERGRAHNSVYEASSERKLGVFEGGVMVLYLGVDCGGGIRTPVLRLMGPASWPLLYSAAPLSFFHRS